MTDTNAARKPEFDIRIMCHEDDVNEVLAAISYGSVLGEARQYPARGGLGKVRVYLQARVRPDDA